MSKAKDFAKKDIERLFEYCKDFKVEVSENVMSIDYNALGNEEMHNYALLLLADIVSELDKRPEATHSRWFSPEFNQLKDLLLKR